MFRFALSAVALAGVLVAAQPSFADPLAATASDHVQAAAPATEQLVPPVPARTPPSDARAPANAGRGKDIIFVGFGWGRWARMHRWGEGHELYVARCVLVLALLFGVVLDDLEVRRRSKPRRDVPPIDAW
jgi:hypothetical protein